MTLATVAVILGGLFYTFVVWLAAYGFGYDAGSKIGRLIGKNEESIENFRRRTGP